MKGVYALILEIEQDFEIRIGKMGKICFSKGYWVYVGSAQGTASTNLENRLRRHFRKEKKIHWHIDHLLSAQVNLVDAVWAESSANLECELVRRLLQKKEFLAGPSGFGASDCKQGCKAHLLRHYREDVPIPLVKATMIEMDLRPNIYSNL